MNIPTLVRFKNYDQSINKEWYYICIESLDTDSWLAINIYWTLKECGKYESIEQRNAKGVQLWREGYIESSLVDIAPAFTPYRTVIDYDFGREELTIDDDRVIGMSDFMRITEKLMSEQMGRVQLYEIERWTNDYLCS